MCIYRKVCKRVQAVATVKGYAAHRLQEVGSTPQQAQGKNWSWKEMKREVQIISRIFTVVFMEGKGQSILSRFRTGKFEILW